jgi:hypothetical protein
MNFLNKKGGEQVMSIYWFVIFGIITIAVVSGVYVFSSKPIDIRAAETNVLEDKIITCIVNNGEVSEKWKEINGGNDLEKICLLNLGDLNYKEMQYYIEIEIGDKSISYGDSSFKAFCGAKKSRNNIPYCREKKIMVLENDKFVLLNLIVSIRKVEQNAV